MIPKYCVLGVEITFIFQLTFGNSSEYAAIDNPPNFFYLDAIIKSGF